MLISEYDDYLFLFEFDFSHNITQPLEEVKAELNALVEMGIVRRCANIINDEDYSDLDEDDEDFYQYSELSEKLGETYEGWTTTYTLDDDYAEQVCDYSSISNFAHNS